VEARQHAADRLGHELAIGNRLDVVRLDRAEDLGELLEFVQGKPSDLVPLRDRVYADADQHAGEGTDADETELLELALHLLSVRAAGAAIEAGCCWKKCGGRWGRGRWLGRTSRARTPRPGAGIPVSITARAWQVGRPRMMGGVGPPAGQAGAIPAPGT